MSKFSKNRLRQEDWKINRCVFNILYEQSYKNTQNFIRRLHASAHSELSDPCIMWIICTPTTSKGNRPQGSKPVFQYNIQGNFVLVHCYPCRPIVSVVSGCVLMSMSIIIHVHNCIVHIGLILEDEKTSRKKRSNVISEDLTRVHSNVTFRHVSNFHSSM